MISAHLFTAVLVYVKGIVQEVRLDFSFPHCTPSDIWNVLVLEPSPDMYNFMDSNSYFRFRHLVDSKLERRSLMDKRNSLLMWSYAVVISTQEAYNFSVRELYNFFVSSCLMTYAIITPLTRMKAKLGCKEFFYRTVKAYLIQSSLVFSPEWIRLRYLYMCEGLGAIFLFYQCINA